MSDLKPDRQRRDLHKSNLPATSRKIGPVLISSVLIRFSYLNCSSILVLCCVSIQFSSVQFSFPYAGSLLPKDNVETFPTRGYLPWEEAGRRSSKKFHRGFPVPGLISTCCQSRPKGASIALIRRILHPS